MKELFKIERSNKAHLEKLLAEDPYSELSFSKNGYLLKELDGVLYLLIEGNESYINFAKQKLKDIAEIPSNKEEIIATIEKLEEEAQQGFGNLFG